MLEMLFQMTILLIKEVTMSRKPLYIFIVISLIALSLIAAYKPAKGQPGIAGRWDRLNPGVPPEHEVMSCGGNANWYCTYDKHPEPGLGFVNPPDSTFGRFRGEDITSEWTCPAWFPYGICDNTTFVASGVMIFNRGELVVDEQLILVENEGSQILYVYWVDQFVCPWYRTFDEALAANPEAAMDCLFTP
jgi:hypothetical protein